MAADRRQDILDAALAAFAEKGVEATSIADLRKASGASVGSIYHHFGAKDGIAGRVYLAVLEQYQSSLRKKLPAFTTPQTYVEGIVRHFVAWVQSNRNAATFLIGMRESPAVQVGEAGIQSSTSSFLDDVYGPLASWMDEGQLRRVPAALLPALVTGPALTASSFWIRGGAKGRQSDYADALAEAAWQSLRP